MVSPAPAIGGGPPQQGGPPAAAVPPGGVVDSRAPPPGGSDDLPDAEQDAQLDSFVDNAYRVIYGGPSENGQVNPSIAESLRAMPEGGAVDSLANTAASVGAKVASAAVEQGSSFDGVGVVLPATLSLVAELAGIAQDEQIYDYSEEEMASAAVKTGEALFEQTQELGIWSKEEFDAGVQEALAADQSGELASMIQQPQQGGAQAPPAPGGGIPEMAPQAAAPQPPIGAPQ